MKKIFTPVVGLAKRTYAEISLKAKKVATAVKSQIEFVALAAEADALMLDAKNFDLALQKETTKSVTQERRTLASSIIAKLEILMWNCYDIAKDDAELFLLTGYSIKKTPVKVTVLEMPKDMTAKYGKNEGEIEITFKGDKHAAFYKVMVGTTPDNMQLAGVYTTSRIVITGLQSSSLYYIKVMACGARGVVSFWSPVISQKAA